MTAKKVLYINQEIIPYVPESEMSTIGRQLPELIQESGCEIRTFMPKWGNINERRGQLHEVIRLSRMMLIIDDTDHPLIIKVASIPSTRIQVYFIDNDDFFGKRQMARDKEGNEYDDNGERAVFFARGVLETVKKLRWIPDVIHCQGWMCSLIPLYIKTAMKDEPSFANTKVITSLFSEQLHAPLGSNFKPSVAFKEVESSILDTYSDNFGFNELLKMSVDYSDGIVEASDNVSPDIMKYAAEKGLPILKHPAEGDLVQVYGDFYDKIYEGKSE